MRAHLVCNQESGGGTVVDEVRAALRANGMTLVDEDAAERIVVAGGDGTVGSGAALAARLDLPLAVIPTGTANDFARAFGLPTDLEEAARLATGDATTRIELGRANDRPFVNTAAAGLASAAARRAVPLKRLLGPLAYPLGALASGVLDRPLRCAVTADGETVFDGTAWQVIVACTGAFGGGAEIDVADPHDGRLDVVVLPAGSRLHLVRYAAALRGGDIAGSAGTVHARADAVDLAVPDRTVFNVDGELVRLGAEVRFTAEHAAVLLVR